MKAKKVMPKMKTESKPKDVKYSKGGKVSKMKCGGKTKK
jgi:hypothetical protein